MRLVISDFVSLDGVAQAPGGPQEDTDGGFANGGSAGAPGPPTTCSPRSSSSRTLPAATSR